MNRIIMKCLVTICKPIQHNSV